MDRVILIPLFLFVLVRDTILALDKVVCTIGAIAIFLMRFVLDVICYFASAMGNLINRLYVLEIALLIVFCFALDQAMTVYKTF